MNQKHYSVTSVLETALWNPDHRPATPTTCYTYMSSQSHTWELLQLGVGVASIQIPEPSSKTGPHPLPPPHRAAIPGWRVDRHLAVTEGSLAGAWERAPSTQVLTPLLQLQCGLVRCFISWALVFSSVKWRD